jgi:hypothetical protein
MIKDGTGIGLSPLKSMCIAIALVLVASAFAVGAITDTGCGVKCRCHSNPMNMDHPKGQPTPSSPDLCNGNPMIPCDLESNPVSGLPEFIPVSVSVNLTQTAAQADSTAECVSDGPALCSAAAIHIGREKPLSAPLYLQKASLLI